MIKGLGAGGVETYSRILKLVKNNDCGYQQ